MTITAQKFRFGSIERRLDLSSTDLQFIIVEDVLEAFQIPKVDRFEVNGLTLPYMRDENYKMYQPKRIPCRPGCVVDVIYEPTRLEATALPLTASSESSSSVMTLTESVEHLTIKRKKSEDTSMDLSEPMNATITRRTTTQLKSLKAAVVQANHSGRAFNSEGMKDLIGKHLVPVNNSESTLQYLSQNMGLLTKDVGLLAKDVGLLVQDVGGLKQKGDLLEQLARKMIEMQQQALDRLSLIQSKTEAILIQQLEIAEYPIPRLFIVLPEEPKEYDPGNWFRTKFRLHFICECGKHTETSESKVQHHLHLAKHDGYVIREPTKFFKKYGPFLLLMLEMIKFGTSVAGIVVPALSSLTVIELSDSVKQTVDAVTAKIDYSLECIDKQFTKKDTSSPEGFAETNSSMIVTQQDLNNFLGNVEGLEGVELRQLGSFLKTSSKDDLLGNLYRMTTTEGHVKWVCLDHYRTGYQEKQVQKLHEVVQQARGKFDEQQGKITITLTSGVLAVEFYNALSQAKGVLELNVKLGWSFSKTDLGVLRKTLKNTRVSILRLDIQTFRPSFGSRLLPTSSPFEAIAQLQDLPHMKKVHIIFPLSFIKTFNFQPRARPQICKLSCEMPDVNKIRQEGFEILVHSLKFNVPLITLDLSSKINDNGTQVLSDALKINCTLTSLDLRYNSIGQRGAIALSEALKINSTLTTLDLGSNLIEEKGAMALSEALKINSTLITLYLWGNSIEEKGATALSESLVVNSTLTTLNLGFNPIRENGVMALFEALKINSTLTNLDLRHNSIQENGAVALSEALKINSTLITLDLWGNSIEEKGATALFESLMINSTLTTLNLGDNSIKGNGVVVLSEALKINSTLTNLDLRHNSIQKNGALVLSEALKANSTLTTLDLGHNSIQENGTVALAEALKVNSTLNTLFLRSNSMRENGTVALSEALMVNSTLTTLDLESNAIGENGAVALSEALKINLTLTTLNLWGNSIRESGAVALSESLKINSTLTTLTLNKNFIGENGAQALFEALKINSTLASLNLGGNFIGDIGALALLEALKINSNLTTLDLSDTNIGGELYQELKKANSTCRIERY